MVFFVLTRFVLVKYSRAFVEGPSQGASFLASRLTTVSLDIYSYHGQYIEFRYRPALPFSKILYLENFSIYGISFALRKFNY